MLTLLDFRVRQRDFLLEISRAITARLDLNEVLKRVVNASVAMLAGQIGVVALRDRTGTYAVRAVVGLPLERAVDLNVQIESLIHTASLRDTELLNQKLREMAQALDSRLIQTFAIPLAIAGEPVGLLIVFRNFQGGATPDDVQVLQSFADQAAIAVHNAQLYERINVDRKRLAAVVQHSADGVMILDASLRILSFNAALERMTAWSQTDVLGKLETEVIVLERSDSETLSQAIERGWPASDSDEIEPLHVEGDLRRRDGLTVSVDIRYAPLFDAEGTLVNVVANVRDMTRYRQAQEMQNVFISTVSHELKTPVALIKGYAATLRRDDVTWDDASIREYSAVIEDEADRLTKLIENLLTASRIQAERGLKLDVGEVHLDQLAARVVERFQMQTPSHAFELRFPDSYPVVPGDENRLRQVIDNLISNAIKYSPEGGTITVSGAVLPDAVTLSVTDQGVGIRADDFEHLFERFFRVDGALTRKTQGAGLGLYLSRAIAEAHQGALTVESRVGEGSTFTLTLPKE